jgi:hypothetical protein
MDPLTAAGSIAINELVRRTLSAILDEAGISGKTWLRKSKVASALAAYESYLLRSVSTISLFGSNRTISVENLYVSVHLSPNLEREKYKSREQIHAMMKDQKSGLAPRLLGRPPERTPLGAINSSSTHMALLGAPGSGKTTALRYLAFLMAKGELIRGSQRIPFYIPVRELNGGLLEAAELALESFGLLDPKKIIIECLKSGRLALLLDGLDETSEVHQKKLIAELRELDARYPKTLLFVSARPYALSVELCNFTKWETLPLAFSERRKFVDRWFKEIDPRKGEALLLRCSTRPEMLDLGSSPLLLSIVCALYHNDLDLPTLEEDLFARASEGLLGGWDAFRSIARTTLLSSLSVNKRVTLVSSIAANLFSRGKIVFSSKDLQETGCLRRAESYLRTRELDEDAILSSLFNDFGIVLERAPGLYSFSHLTLHEYFVARYIVDNRTELALLERYRKDRNWSEVIRLVARMLPRVAAVRFLENLTVETDIEDEYSVDLLGAVWGSGPMSTDLEARSILRNLLVRVKESLELFPGRLDMSVSESERTIYIDHEDSPLWGLGLCLPSLIKLMLRAGLTSEGLDTQVHRPSGDFDLLGSQLTIHFTGRYPII